jgi:hydrogenase/urease accessory protein HupE
VQSSRNLLAVSLALSALVPATRAFAHGQRIARVELIARSAEHAELILELAVPEPSLSFSIDDCTVTEAGSQPEALERRFAIACDGTGEGRTFHMQGLGPIIDRAVFHATSISGAETTALLSPDAPSLTLSEAHSSGLLFARYVRLGLRHIASGADHLLFLLLLVLALRRLRAVLWAETAFTLSHTLSYAATSLGWLHVPSAPTEVCIALSLLLLAADVDIERPLPAARGAATAFVFGFVHGLGFAGGLQDVGVDAHSAGFAILAFGAGVELAQLAAVLLGWALFSLLARSRAWPSVAYASVLAGGSASGYWLLERSAALLSQ